VHGVPVTRRLVTSRALVEQVVWLRPRRGGPVRSFCEVRMPSTEAARECPLTVELLPVCLIGRWSASGRARIVTRRRSSGRGCDQQPGPSGLSSPAREAIASRASLMFVSTPSHLACDMKDSIGTQDPPYDSFYAIAETGYHDPPGAKHCGDPYQLQCRFYLTAAKPPHARLGLVHRRVQIGYLP
jgi:hypothetical protein